MDKKRYCAVLLDGISRKHLLERFSKYIPHGWIMKMHHMTIDPFDICNDKLTGKSVVLKVTEFGISQEACAVKVEGYHGKTNNAFPHVTLAIHPTRGKAKHSNDITKWKKLTNPFFIKGTIENL